MSPKAIYRCVRSAGTTLTAVSVVLHIALRDQLPPPLKAWMQEQVRKALAAGGC